MQMHNDDVIGQSIPPRMEYSVLTSELMLGVASVIAGALVGAVQDV
jgi:hypothetical protein